MAPSDNMDIDPEVCLLNAKKEMIFSRMSNVYELSKKITDYSLRFCENFMASSETIEDLRVKFEEIIDQLNRLMLEDNPKFTPNYQELCAFDDMYSRVKRVRSNIINDSKVNEPSTSKPKGYVKLPAIEIPCFDGNIANWPIFYESFKANVHNNPQLTDCHRVQYLIGKLTHNATKVLAGIVPNGETYNIIWGSLVKKYQDVRNLGTHYLNNILDLKNSNYSAQCLEVFIERYSASISALKQLNISELSDFIFLNCALRKLDAQSVHAFELSVRDKEIPSSQDLISFIQDQVKILQRSNNNYGFLNNKQGNLSNTTSKSPGTSSTSTHKKNTNTFSTNTVVQVDGKCSYCRISYHTLENCEYFLNLKSPKARYDFIKSRNGCVNCCALTHTLTKCKSSCVCELCHKRHHTLLHFVKEHDDKHITSQTAQVIVGESGYIASPTAIQPQNLIIPSSTLSLQSCISAAVGRETEAHHPPASATDILSHVDNNSFSLNAKVKPSAILLGTAQVYAKAKDDKNKKRLIRILLDSGSQNHLISTTACKLLNIPIIPLSNSIVKGIGLSSRPIYGYVTLEIESRLDPKHSYKIDALVVDCLTDELPSCHIDKSKFTHLNKIYMADLTWNIPGNIDLILGCQLFPYIYIGDRIESNNSAPPALSTVFGYVLMGDVPNTFSVSSFSGCALNDVVQKFWELEELPQIKYMSPEETECENVYRSTVSRDNDGRYKVSLPFCRSPAELGNSRATALRRFMLLERKFRHSSELKEKYINVINDYIDNEYLSEVPQVEIHIDGYYIPHHGVIRPDKPLPRVVLDASAKTHTGLSLNDVLHAGPNLQADLFLLLLDFRLFPVAMTADIKQMYLQIGIPENDRKYLRILFRFNDKEMIRTFQFNRLPFGLKSSPYLAMRTVRKLAEDMSHEFPDAAAIVKNLYMDDLVHSLPNSEIAISLSKQLVSLFKSGSFDLVKWTSNDLAVLQNLPDSHRSMVDFSKGNQISKVLGLAWEPAEDNFFVTVCNTETKCTKRNILSTVARLFDVLGIISPVILFAKLLIKELWLCKVDWDETPSESVINRFATLTQELPFLSDLRIPRHIGASDDAVVNIVAFCDASMHGYGCVIYLHCTNKNHAVTVRLLCAKSKVSPTKIITLARLELCAAVLMSKLVKIVRDTYIVRVSINGIYAFCDSTIALSWIHSSPHRWSVFVSNRIAQCQENLEARNFYHVNGNENPSDCVSRGMLPSQLLSNDLWWHGPKWLINPPSEWPIEPFFPKNLKDLPDLKITGLISRTCPVDTPLLYDLAKRVSSWEKLLRATIYVLRLLKKVQTMNVKAFSVAEIYILRAVQKVYFENDIKLIRSDKFPSKKLQKLSVFLDESNVLRIGGRLSNSDLPFEVKHPALLPKHDHVVNLIIRHYHVINCHTGPSLLMSILRQRFWILDARTIVRSKIRECNVCFKSKPSHPTPKMADLPACRISEAKAFMHTGVDYAGPIRITLSRRRGQHAQKAYICIFVCLVVKAVHIELVSDLTSDSFLAAFKRFISRRGPVSCLYSDNGTNFVGAKAQLDDLYKLLMDPKYNNELSKELISRRIEWKMIPPRSPHHGGIWESNIKSLKTHLYRVIGTQLLSYEELQTVLIQIECILNSRPLNVVTSDPHPDIITPAHFLMSTPLQYLPAPDLSNQSVNLVQRKLLLDNMIQSFWKKWHLEYLHTLQVRQKWASPDQPITIGTVVLIGQDDAPPLNWPLGKIIEVYPGNDGIVRVALVRTKSGLLKRPVVKLYPLPTQ